MCLLEVQSWWKAESNISLWACIPKHKEVIWIILIIAYIFSQARHNCHTIYSITTIIIFHQLIIDIKSNIIMTKINQDKIKFQSSSISITLMCSGTVNAGFLFGLSIYSIVCIFFFFLYGMRRLVIFFLYSKGSLSIIPE